MQSKVFVELEMEVGPIHGRASVYFPIFMYDSIIMQYGLINIAIKILMQLVNGLKKLSNE
jgi:hypothetical protein